MHSKEFWTAIGQVEGELKGISIWCDTAPSDWTRRHAKNALKQLRFAINEIRSEKRESKSGLGDGILSGGAPDFPSAERRNAVRDASGD